MSSWAVSCMSPARAPAAFAKWAKSQQRVAEAGYRRLSPSPWRVPTEAAQKVQGLR